MKGLLLTRKYNLDTVWKRPWILNDNANCQNQRQSHKVRRITSTKNNLMKQMYNIYFIPRSNSFSTHLTISALEVLGTRSSSFHAALEQEHTLQNASTNPSVLKFH
jgi:hypothetical protein